MPKVSEQHREARRDQIVDAALRCFAVKGFHRTSMADIIAEARMSAGAIYLHFDGKQQIALAVAQRILGNRMTEFAERLRQDGELPRPSSMLRLMMTGLTSEVGDPRLLVQLWGEAVTDPEVSLMIGPIFGEVRKVMIPYLTQVGRRTAGHDSRMPRRPGRTTWSRSSSGSARASSCNPRCCRGSTPTTTSPGWRGCSTGWGREPGPAHPRARLEPRRVVARARVAG